MGFGEGSEGERFWWESLREERRKGFFFGIAEGGKGGKIITGSSEG